MHSVAITPRNYIKTKQIIKITWCLLRPYEMAGSPFIQNVVGSSCDRPNEILERNEAKKKSEREEREKKMRNITIYLRFGGNYFNDFLPPWIFSRSCKQRRRRRRRKSVSLRLCVTYRSGEISPEISGRPIRCVHACSLGHRPTACGINFVPSFGTRIATHIFSRFCDIHFCHAIRDQRSAIGSGRRRSVCV